MLAASNELELEKILRSMDTSVPRRSEGRTKKHTERYAIAHLLSTLIGEDCLSYPLELLQQERPDFLLKTVSMQIGIEHTEVVPQNEAHKATLRDNGNGPEVYFISHHQPGEPQKTAKQLIQAIETNHAGKWWIGDSVEREWSEAMFFYIQSKIDNFMKEEFKKFEQNWLLIYDNWSLPALEREQATQLLSKKILENNCFEKFDHIHIITGNFLYEFARTSVIQHKINNLWT